LATSESTHIYLLWHETDGVFKLGKANDVHARMASLPDAIDVARSRQMRVPSTALATRLEKLCHVLFSAHARPRPHRGDGYTEWFDTAVHEQAVAFLEANRDLMGCGPLTPVPPKARNDGALASVGALSEARQQARESMREALAARHREERRQFNAQALGVALEWLQTIEEKTTVIGWCDTTLVVWVNEGEDLFRSLGQLHHFLVEKRVFSIFEGCSGTANGILLFECQGDQDWMRGRCAKWGLPELEPLERMLLAAPPVPPGCVDDLRQLMSVSFCDEMRASEDEQRAWRRHIEKVTSRMLAEVMEDRKPVPDFEQCCIEMADAVIAPGQIG